MNRFLGQVISGTIVFACLFSGGSARASMKELCRTILRQYRLEAPYFVSPGQWLSTRPALRKKLQAAAFRLRRSSWLNRSVSVPSVSIQGRPYRVVQHLGQGSEATVYLVEDANRQRFSWKVFDAAGEAMWNREMLERWGQLGLATARIHFIDASQKALLMEYIDGVSVADLQMRGAEWGLTAEEGTIIAREFDRQMKGRTSLENAINTFVETSTGRFVIIDPH